MRTDCPCPCSLPPSMRSADLHSHHRPQRGLPHRPPVEKRLLVSVSRSLPLADTNLPLVVHVCRLSFTRHRSRQSGCGSVSRSHDYLSPCGLLTFSSTIFMFRLALPLDGARLNHLSRPETCRVTTAYNVARFSHLSSLICSCGSPPSCIRHARRARQRSFPPCGGTPFVGLVLLCCLTACSCAPHLHP